MDSIYLKYKHYFCNILNVFTLIFDHFNASYVKIECHLKCSNFSNILQYYILFYCIYDQIKTTLVSIRDLIIFNNV